MMQDYRTQLLRRIEIGKKQLEEISRMCDSLIHNKVLQKSRELDDLIYKYHLLYQS